MPSIYSAPPLTAAPKQYHDKHYIKNLAHGRWPHILNYFGIDASFLTKKHGPCPSCGGKDRFRFDDKNGDGTFICNKCGAGDGVKLLQLKHSWGFHYALEQVNAFLGGGSQHVSTIEYSSNILSRGNKTCPQNNMDEIAKNKQRLNKTWKESRPVTIADPVDTYLKARGIELTQYPTVLRFHPCLPYYDDNGQVVAKFPAMLAMVMDADNQPVSIHRTYLGDGCKAPVEKPKKLMSAIFEGATRGGAIKLSKPNNRQLATAEGIENALAFHIATGLPVWATVSAGGMGNVVIPNDVKLVTIAVDNDENNIGQNAAEKLKKRLLKEGRQVRCVMPPKVDTDFADILVGGM